MTLLYWWLSYVVIGATLLLGKAITCRLLGIFHNHYQIGFSPVVARFKLFQVTFSIGIIVPLPWLFKLYEIHDTAKQRITPIWMRREFSWIKRFSVIVGGLVFLYLVSISLQALNYYTTEHSYLSLDDVNKNGVYVDSAGMELGLRSEDKIIEFNGEKPERFSQLRSKLFTEDLKKLTLIRNDSILEIVPKSEEWIVSALTTGSRLVRPIRTIFPFKIDSVLIDGNAYHAGLQKGDAIVTLNDDTIYFFQDFAYAMGKHKNSVVRLGVKRSDQDGLLSLAVETNNNGMVGIMTESALHYSTEKNTLLGSLNSGNTFIADYLSAFKLIFAPKDELRTLGGFQSIGGLFPQQYKILQIISMMMLVYLCFSIFPTPITEGRYLVALLIDPMIQLPKNAPAWISWILLILLALLANLVDLMELFW